MDNHIVQVFSIFVCLYISTPAEEYAFPPAENIDSCSFRVFDMQEVTDDSLIRARIDSFTVKNATSFFDTIVSGFGKIHSSKHFVLPPRFVCGCGLSRTAKIFYWWGDNRLDIEQSCPQSRVTCRLFLGDLEHSVKISDNCNDFLKKKIRENRFKVHNTGKLWECTSMQDCGE